jgi:uncharacterized surface protein with fasciclin (FAS1) repeats
VIQADLDFDAQATGLDTTLNNATAMMTVFVPVNAAFDALAQQQNSTLNALLAQAATLTPVNSLPVCFIPAVTALSN